MKSERIFFLLGYEAIFRCFNIISSSEAIFRCFKDDVVWISGP